VPGEHCVDRPLRLSWAERLQRLCAIDMKNRPNCCGELRIAAAILPAQVIQKTFASCAWQCRSGASGGRGASTRHGSEVGITA
jgi:hypothetical protein